jgi:acyl carrier protein
MEDIKQRLKQLVVERLFIEDDPTEIADDEDLREKYDLDSPKVFDLVIGLEEEFDISFEGDDEFDLERFATINQMADVLKEKGAEA